MSERDLIVVKTTFLEKEKAETVAALLVDAGLAVCAQVDSEMVLFFRSEGIRQKKNKIAVMFTVLPQRLELFLGELKLQHTESDPQIMGWPTTIVDKDYLEWAHGKKT